MCTSLVGQMHNTVFHPSPYFLWLVWRCILCVLNSALLWLLRQTNRKQRIATVALDLCILKRIPGCCVCLEFSCFMLGGAAAPLAVCCGTGLQQRSMMGKGYAQMMVSRAASPSQNICRDGTASSTRNASAALHFYFVKLSSTVYHLPLTCVPKVRQESSKSSSMPGDKTVHLV